MSDTGDELRRRTAEAVERLKTIPAMFEDTMVRARAESGGGSDHDQLVHVTLNQGGAVLQLTIDEALLVPGGAAALAKRIEAAHAVAFRALSARTARQGEQLTALAEQLAQLQHRGGA